MYHSTQAKRATVYGSRCIYHALSLPLSLSISLSLSLLNPPFLPLYLSLSLSPCLCHTHLSKIFIAARYVLHEADARDRRPPVCRIVLRVPLVHLFFVDPVPVHHVGNPGANLESIFHRCYLREVAFECELTKETIYLPLGCLQGGCVPTAATPDQIASLRRFSSSCLLSIQVLDVP